jgi:hypothetical protein
MAMRDIEFGNSKDFTSLFGSYNDARVFAGIHFRTACLDGNILGNKVGLFAMQHTMLPIS